MIEATGRIESATEQGSGRIFWISSPLTPELKPDQSLSHDGVCLTVEQVADSQYRVTAILETLQKTNLATWQVGNNINLERCMQLNGRLDGHIVQGHVDARGKCTSVETKEGSWEYTFSFPSSFASLMIEKGSICVNGISLTCFNVTNSTFKVAIIPFTYEHTNMRDVKENSLVNLEFDVLGKYIQRNLSLK
ncbi:MAG: riboflavin synthase [Proteobacteria bacterium]|nr:MAG: riboflavin synthase [Pseudomonadota bacterium]